MEELVRGHAEIDRAEGPERLAVIRLAVWGDADAVRRYTATMRRGGRD